jgi:gliding motility-associated-like protein
METGATRRVTGQEQGIGSHQILNQNGQDKMKYAGIFALVLISIGTSAQFSDKRHLKFPAGSEPLQVKWADVDNDSILDIVTANRINGAISFIAWKDSAFLSTHELVRTGFTSGTFSLCDFNRDNRIDIIMSGVDTLGNHSTEVYLWEDSLVYRKQTARLSAFSSPRVALADLNSNGQGEFVMAGNAGRLSAWRWNGTTAVHLFDSADMIVDDVLVYDFDRNGFNDIAASGADAAGRPRVLIIEFANAFDTIRTIKFQSPVAGKMDAGDVDNDGFLDLVISGRDTAGTVVTRTFLNRISRFVSGKGWVGIDAASLQIADIDADGYADLSVQGYQGTSPRNFVRTFSGDSIVLPAKHVMTQAFGDYDRDGDLDVLQLMDTLGMVLMENETLNVNLKPRAPTFEAGLFIFNRLFLYWTPDSITDSVSYASTYDLALSETGIAYAGEFNMDSTWQRLTVAHGNMSTNNYALLRIPVTAYAAKLQTVDNAFVGSKPLGTHGGGICDIEGGPPNCPPEVQNITACSSDPIELTPQEPKKPAAWFSFSKGFMGIHTDSLMVASKADTIFSMILGGGRDCERFRIYLINESGPSDTIRVTNSTTACEGAVVELNVAEEWEEVIWKNPARDSIGSGDTLHYVVRNEEALTASARNDHGCFLKQTENLNISKPVLTTNGDAFKIMKGESVGLSASGAHVYVWTPNQSLDNGFIANPQATPSETTAYTVTGYDTLGCTATKQVVVQVEQTAFVPNLFTPNGDGTNDQLRIYGLSHANNFRFAIHNRDGNLVYEAKDVNAVTSRGWDGSNHGVGQPPGLYYWKVEGTFDDGTSLQLNGRTTGSILMVR